MDFRQTARLSVIGELGSLCSNVEALSGLILHLRIGSGLDRSSPKHMLKCLSGRRAEEEER